MLNLIRWSIVGKQWVQWVCKSPTFWRYLGPSCSSNNLDSPWFFGFGGATLSFTMFYPLISWPRRCGWSTTAHADPTGQDPHVTRGGHQGDGAAIPRLEGGRCAMTAMIDERCERLIGGGNWIKMMKPLNFKVWVVWLIFDTHLSYLGQQNLEILK